MMGHAFGEGWVLLRRRWLTSFSLVLGLAVPLALAVLTAATAEWAWPLVRRSEEQLGVPALLHPRMDDTQRREWIEKEKREHPDWDVRLVPPEKLAERLVLWFPYLQDFFENEEGAELPPLVEIRAPDPEEIRVLEQSPAVIALGPTRSVHQLLGRMAGETSFLMAMISGILLFVAVLMAGIWTHLEIYRHADEISIMRLVGATETAIRSPLIIAVMIPGLLAGLLAGLGAVFLVRQTGRALSCLGLGVPSVSGWMLLGVILAAVLLPGIAAMFTLMRHARIDDER